MATSITFNEIEKIIQEKLFYNILFEEYYRAPEIIGTGFRMSQYEFIINMVVIRPFPVNKILELAEKIGEIYITSEHDESILSDESFKKMLLK